MTDEIPGKKETQGPSLTGASSPYEGLLAQLVAKIRSEPFLLIIAVSALLVGLATAGAQLGSWEFRLIVLIIGVLALAAVVGYYFIEIMRSPRGTRGPRIEGRVKVGVMGDDAQASGVKVHGPQQGQGMKGTVDVGRATGRAKATGVEFGDESPDVSVQDSPR